MMQHLQEGPPPVLQCNLCELVLRFKLCEGLTQGTAGKALRSLKAVRSMKDIPYVM
jgi:hypothetical protein